MERRALPRIPSGPAPRAHPEQGRPFPEARARRALNVSAWEAEQVQRPQVGCGVLPPDGTSAGARPWMANEPAKQETADPPGAAGAGTAAAAVGLSEQLVTQHGHGLRVSGEPLHLFPAVLPVAARQDLQGRTLEDHDLTRLGRWPGQDLDRRGSRADQADPPVDKGYLRVPTGRMPPPPPNPSRFLTGGIFGSDSRPVAMSPPRSLAPLRSRPTDASRPNFGQAAWILPRRPCSISRATACSARVCRQDGPGTFVPARPGAVTVAAGTNGIATNSVNPPVRS